MTADSSDSEYHNGVRPTNPPIPVAHPFRKRDREASDEAQDPVPVVTESRLEIGDQGSSDLVVGGVSVHRAPKRARIEEVSTYINLWYSACKLISITHFLQSESLSTPTAPVAVSHAEGGSQTAACQTLLGYFPRSISVQTSEQGESVRAD